MKLRIKGSALRLRLTRSEVRQLGDTGRVTETIRFSPDRRMNYILEATDAAERLQARYEDDVIVVQLPAAWVTSWADDDRVGFEERQPVAGGEMLELLVEKDFQCLHKEREARAEDRYAHPEAGAKE